MGPALGKMPQDVDEDEEEDAVDGIQTVQHEAALMSVYDRYASYMGYGPVSGSR